MIEKLLVQVTTDNMDAKRMFYKLYGNYIYAACLACGVNESIREVFNKVCDELPEYLYSKIKYEKYGYAPDALSMWAVKKVCDSEAYSIPEFWVKANQLVPPVLFDEPVIKEVVDTKHEYIPIKRKSKVLKTIVSLLPLITILISVIYISSSKIRLTYYDQLKIEIILDSETYKVGENIKAVCRVTNVTEKDINIMANGDRSEAIILYAQSVNGNKIPSSYNEFYLLKIILKPGATIEKEVTIYTDTLNDSSGSYYIHYGVRVLSDKDSQINTVDVMYKKPLYIYGIDKTSEPMGTPITPIPTPTPIPPFNFYGISISDLPAEVSRFNFIYNSKGICLIGEIPEEEIYVYGVMNPSYNQGVILRIGDKMQYYEEWYYYTPRCVMPEVFYEDIDKDGIKEILMIFYAESGSGVSVEELRIVKPNYVIWRDYLLDGYTKIIQEDISSTLDMGSKTMTIYTKTDMRTYNIEEYYINETFKVGFYGEIVDFEFNNGRIIGKFALHITSNSYTLIYLCDIITEISFDGEFHYGSFMFLKK